MYIDSHSIPCGTTLVKLTIFNLTTLWMAQPHGNIQRDRKVRREIRAMGWHVIIVWECELRNLQSVAERMDVEL